MEEKNTALNRRKHKRVKVEAGAYVAFNKKRFFKFMKPVSVKLGPIIDLSRGGLAVQYIESKDRTSDFKELSILTAAGEVIFDNVPFSIVSDNIIAEMPDSKRIRKLCVQFGSLSGYQLFRIEQLINNLDLHILPFESLLDKKKKPAAKKKKAAPAKQKKEAVEPVYTEETEASGDEKNKFEMQSDILNKFRAIKAKEGYVLTPGWLGKTYIPSLSESERKNFKEAVHELVLQGIIEIIREPKQNFMLTSKGEKLIYQTGKAINYNV